MTEGNMAVPDEGRRRLLRGLLLGGVAVGGGVVGAGAAAATTNGTGWRRETLTYDVACIGDLWREATPWNRSELGTDFRAPFLVEGWMYLPGTVPPEGFVPTPDGAIGRWFCRGWVAIDENRFEPHASSNHDYILGEIRPDALFPPDTLASIGLEGTETDQVGTRAVIGGTGIYAGATGTVTQAVNGTNTTILNDGGGFNAPNFIFEFDLLVPEL